MKQVVNIFKKIGLPYAYDHFAEGESPKPPFICYLTASSDNFAADGKVYFKFDEIHLELYADKKDPKLESKVEDALDAAEIFYDKTETWIESEQLYEVLYTFRLEAD